MLFDLMKIKAMAITAGASLVVGIALGGWGASVVYVPRVTAAVSEGKAEAERLKALHIEAAHQAALAHAKALGIEREKEKALRADVDLVQANGEKEKARVQAAADRLVADIRSGERRLSIAVRSSDRTGHSEACRGSAAAGGGGDEARAELDPAAGERIVAITRDGDDAIVSLNACIDAYEAVRLRLNAAEVLEPAL